MLRLDEGEREGGGGGDIPKLLKRIFPEDLEAKDVQDSDEFGGGVIR